MSSDQTIVDTLVGAIIKRVSYGRHDGVAIIAERLVLDIDPADLSSLSEVERDAHGHIRIAEVNIGEILKAQVVARLKHFGVKATIVAKNIGYELRCADPIPYEWSTLVTSAIVPPSTCSRVIQRDTPLHVAI